MVLQKISKNVAQYIKSQQYITNTYMIAKELIENALDAQATSIKAIITNDSIIVEDNGCGIEDLDIICRPGFTSKEEMTYKVLGIQQNCSQFSHGYRGQALASINQMCAVEILSKCKDEHLARFKNYTTGTILDKPRETGTTVKISNLFNKCPLRKKENEKTMRKSIQKLIALMNGFSYVNDTNFLLIYNNHLMLNEKGSSDTKSHVIEKHGVNLMEIEDELFSLYLFPLNKSATQVVLIDKRVCRYEKAESIIKSIFAQYFEYNPTFVLILRDECDVNISTDKSEILLKNCSYVENKIRSEMNRYFALKLFIHGSNDINNEVSAIVENTEEEKCIDKQGLNIKSYNEEKTRDIENNNKTSSLIVKEVENNVNEQENRTNTMMGCSDPIKLNALDIAISTENSNVESNSISELNIEISNKSTSFILDTPVTSTNITSTMNIKEECCLSNCCSTQINSEPVNNENKISNNTTEECINGNSLDIATIEKTDKKEIKITGSVYKTISEERGKYTNFVFDKADFKNLKIIGQFNQGFILCILEKNNKKSILAVDQHAADEIYNFEKLKQTFKLKKQKLLVPVDLQLSAIQQILVQENMQILNENGFDVEDGKLVTLPVYFGIVFTVEDFYLLLNNIANDIFITDKLRNIMASKACRSSVMIGTCLNVKEMKRLLDNLSTLDVPWNCPHGRPTFKILTEL